MVPDGTNPCRGIGRHRERRRERFLTDTEFRRLGRVLDRAVADGGVSGHAVAAIRLLLLTGCRKSEILSLKGVGCGKGRNDTPSERSMFGRRERAAPKRAQVPYLTVRRHQAESGERYAFHSDPYPVVTSTRRTEASIPVAALHDK